jgi:hypothetical protein
MMSARMLTPAAGILLLVASLSCGGGDGDGAAGPQRRSICFSVSGFDVTVANMWQGGGTHTTNVRGLAAFTETVSRGGETHTLQWTNIQNNYTTQRVDAFNVRIDGAALSYPGNQC